MSYLSDLLGAAYSEGMSEEDISSALQAIKTKEEDELNRLKAALSRSNSEAAEYKKQLRAKQTDDEAKAAAEKEERENLLQNQAKLERELYLIKKQSQLIAMGYDERLAQDTAAAMADNDMDKVLANQATYLAAQKKAIEADHMRNTPRPPAGSDGAPAMDYGKMIAEAQASGDIAAAAYYTRLKEQESNKPTD